MTKSGYSFVEVLVGVALLSIVGLGFLQFQSQTNKMVRVVSDNAAFSQALMAIERELSAEMPFLPPQEEVNEDKASPLFADTNISGTRCYDKTGERIACDAFDTDPQIYFRTKFYKAAVKDRTFHPSSPHASIPLSRLRFQVEYKVNNKIQEPMYFARLFADTMRY